MTTWSTDVAGSPTITGSPTPITNAGDILLIATGVYSFRKTVAATFAVNWSAGATPFIFIDGAGNAQVYPITFNAPDGYTINGQPAAFITDNWGWMTIILDGTNYLMTKGTS